MQVRLQKCLASLAAAAPAHGPVFRDAAARSRRALDPEDARLLRTVARSTWAGVRA